VHAAPVAVSIPPPPTPPCEPPILAYFGRRARWSCSVCVVHDHAPSSLLSCDRVTFVSQLVSPLAQRSPYAMAAARIPGRAGGPPAMPPPSSPPPPPPPTSPRPPSMRGAGGPAGSRLSSALVSTPPPAGAGGPELREFMLERWFAKVRSRR
jgi:hypothetical protein